MGKVGQRKLRLVSALPAEAARNEALILCPFLAGLDPAVAMWLGPLAWHDCNAALLQALAAPVPAGMVVFAGIFCADPFRAPDDLLAALRRAGVAGVVNLPSITFLDGEVGQTLQALHLGGERELEFLRAAKAQGFAVACCTCEPGHAREMIRAGAEFLITHAGAPVPPSARRSRGAAFRVAQVNVQAIALSALLSAMP